MTPDLESLRALAEKVAETDRKIVAARNAGKFYPLNDFEFQQAAHFKSLTEAEKVLALLRRLEEGEKALRPFAEIGAVVPEWVRDDDFVDVCTAQNMKDWRRIEYGQLRAAARHFQHSEKKADV